MSRRIGAGGTTLLTMLNGIDLALWDGGRNPVTEEWLNKTVDFTAYRQAGWHYTFIKVSESTYKDRMFDLQWAAARGHVYRGGYHFFYPPTDIVPAVESFIAYMAGDNGELPPVLDLESTGGMSGYLVATRALAWLEEYERRMGVRPIVYSSLYFLRDVIHAGSFPKFADYKLWMAQYYYENMEEPGRSETIHSVLVGEKSHIFPAMPAPFVEMPFHQWTALGDPLDVPGYYTGPGSKKAVDFNKYDGDLAKLKDEFGLGELPDAPDPKPPQDKTEEIYDGVVNVTGTRNGWDFSLLIVDLAKAEFKVYHTAFDVATSVADKTGAQIVTNGGEPDRENGVIIGMEDFSVDNGRVYQERTNKFHHSLVFYKDGRVIFDYEENNRNNDVLHALSCNHWLVENGVNLIPPDGTEAKYTEGHSRTVFGLTREGYLIISTSRGAYPNQGLRLYEAAELAIQYGAIEAGTGGGGGDTEQVINGEITIVPENPGGAERYLLEFACIYTKENDMPTSGSIKGVAKAGTLTNIKPMAGGEAIRQLSGGQYVYGKYSTLKTDIIDFDHYYDSANVLHDLGALCKCSVTNLTVTAEPETPVDPDPDPTPPQASDIPMKLSWTESETHEGGEVSWTIKAKS